MDKDKFIDCKSFEDEGKMYDYIISAIRLGFKCEVTPLTGMCMVSIYKK